MTQCYRSAEKRKTFNEIDSGNEGFVDSRLSTAIVTSKQPMDSEKRIRREIANSNERRRMQSINVGFQCLKALLPQHSGEKLSKAAILQQTSDYVKALEKDKSQLLLQNAQLRQKMKEICPQELDGLSPPPKRKKRDTESSDEGIGLGFEDASSDYLELKKKLDRERQQRVYLEQRIHNLESQMDSERLKLCFAQPRVKQEPKILLKHELMDSNPSTDAARLQKPQQSYSPPADGSGPMEVLPTKLPSQNSATKAPNTEFTSPQSKRNLEIIAEAIRHLEGDNMFPDSASCRSVGEVIQNSRMEIVHRSNIPNSEESQTESSTSDQEDCKYDSSGCDSPLSLSIPDSVNVGLTNATATLRVTSVNKQQQIANPVTEMALVGSSLFSTAVVVSSSSS